ncbi:MAG: type III-B CRISPR-associated protein Cas10/Cmr2 [Desulfobacula sp.]|jgi:CRISPR-associated protein Cmr2|nr:type III-B CRISPR-associated protein Cas10/Cmr2 [Desulfobacula sp.]
MIKRDEHYWEQKMRIFLHDPVDKALRIPGHERRASEIANTLGVSTPDKAEVVLADIMASGLDRANLPGYSSNVSANGAIDFAKYPEITHPISGASLKFTGQYDSAEEVTNQIVEIIEKDTNDTSQVWDKQTYFNYLFFILRKRLITENCGNLGFLWDKIPADSRIPDHAIWNHAGMVSALHTAFNESETRGASMVVVSLTPVQPFIGKTRKLRDHWVASVILSWLTFEGICAIMETLGPDHILYPSLQDQPLVEASLSSSFEHFFDAYRNKVQMEKDETVASFPNKFVFLAPSGQEAEFVTEVEERIQKEWKALADIVLSWIDAGDDPALRSMFNRQVENWWQFSWSSAHLVSLKNQADIETLFEKEKFASLFKTIKDFSRKYSNADYVYPVTHSLVQTIMAVGKNAPVAVRNKEPGMKCPVCGELEILHDLSGSDHGAAGYKDATDKFWQRLSRRFSNSGSSDSPEAYGSSMIKKDEKLCAICSIKRFAPNALEKLGKTHLLRRVFRDGNFPSTTELATVEFRDRLKQEGLLPSDKERCTPLERQLIDELHEREQESGKYSEDVTRLLKAAKKKNITRDETDNYYAVLMMDGDKIGELVNGTSIEAKWKDVLHPRLIGQYTKGILKAEWDLWTDYLDNQRILSPALHATLSESLGVFSLYAVPRIINAHQGKLIYAGGDDVVAVLPLSKAFDAARKIQQAYNMRFATLSDHGVRELGPETDGTVPIMVLPGKGDGISISASILICHHKQPLRGALEEGHRLLDVGAKEGGDRNAIAIRLRKRSGHKRDFIVKWNAVNLFFPGKEMLILDSFSAIQEGVDNGILSGSLIYRLAEPELGIMAGSVLGNINGHCTPGINPPSAENIEHLIRFFAREISHSGTLIQKYPGQEYKEKRETISRTLAAHMAGITIDLEKARAGHKNGKKQGDNDLSGNWIYNGQVPAIARYLSRGGACVKEGGII